VDITSQDHSDLAVILDNLGGKLGSRFEKTGRINDLEESIRRIQQTMNITLQDHSDLTIILNNLGSKFEKRFQKTGRIEDLEESIRRTQ
jgi:hypothetical protein